MKRLGIEIVIFLLLGVALWGAIRYGSDQHREAIRLQSNQTALLSDIEHYQVHDSLQAASIRVLTLRSSEVEGHFAELTALVKDMGVKIRRMESVSQAAIESNYEITAPVRDTVVLSQPAQLVRYDDGHIRLDGTIAVGMFRGGIITRDTLTQVVHRVPRRFLFIRYGIKELRQEIVSSNPHSRIVYSRYLKIDK